MPSLLWDVRTAVHTLFVVALNGTSTKVIDGPRARSDAPKRFLLVGVSGDDGLGDAGVRTIQEANPMEGDWRTEVGEIDCTAVAWDGNADALAELRAAVRSITDACETAINTDCRLGGLLKAGMLAEINSITTREAHTEHGPFVEAVLTVGYGALLT